MGGYVEEIPKPKERCSRGIEKGTKTVEYIVNLPEYAAFLSVVSWKECVLPSWWRVRTTAAGTFEQYERI